MSTRSTASDVSDAKRVQRQFEDWRRRRRSGTRIPDELWRAAVDLVPELGVSKTSQFLRLDYYSLKKRVEAAARQQGLGEGDGARFVEIPVAAATGAGGGACVLEIEDTSGGVRLRMELRGMAAVELGSLVRSVLGAER